MSHGGKPTFQSTPYSSKSLPVALGVEMDGSSRSGMRFGCTSARCMRLEMYCLEKLRWSLADEPCQGRETAGGGRMSATHGGESNGHGESVWRHLRKAITAEGEEVALAVCEMVSQPRDGDAVLLANEGEHRGH